MARKKIHNLGKRLGTWQAPVPYELIYSSGAWHFDSARKFITILKNDNPRKFYAAVIRSLRYNGFKKIR